MYALWVHLLISKLMYVKSQREIHVQWWHLTFKYYYWLSREGSMKQAGVKFSFFTAFNNPYPNLFSLSVFLDKGFWKNELYNSILCLLVGLFNVKTEFLLHVRIISDLDFFHINIYSSDYYMSWTFIVLYQFRCIVAKKTSAQQIELF